MRTIELTSAERLLVCLSLVVITACAPTPTATAPAGSSPPISAAAQEDGGMLPAWPAALEISVPHDARARGSIFQEEVSFRRVSDQAIQLCQNLSPAAPYAISGVDCFNGDCGCGCAPGGEAHWGQQRLIPWQQYGQGEYVGPSRLPHVLEYRLRPDDTLEFVYRLTRDESVQPYELNVGDSIKVESLTDKNLDRELIIQPDGTVSLRLLGQVHAARRTVAELEADLEKRYTKYYKVPAITVTPIKVNTKLEDIRSAVNSQFGAGGQTRVAKVTPEGTVQLVAVGSVPAQGLSIQELYWEVNERYKQIVQGLEVTPVLTNRAPRHIFVLGEVRTPGRFNMEGPTTAMQAIALAGSWSNGGNVREIVVFRRADDWRLMATRLDLRGAMLGHRPCPADEIWLRDSDIVVVPKMPIKIADDLIELVFTKGIYGVIPFQGISINLGNGSTLGGSSGS